MGGIISSFFNHFIIYEISSHFIISLRCSLLGQLQSPGQAALFLSPPISQSQCEAKCDCITAVLENHSEKDTGYR